MNKLIISGLVGVTLFLGGCGSSSSEKEDTKIDDTNTTTLPVTNNNNNNNNNASTSNWTPITTKVSCDPTPIVGNGITIDSKYYADGDIKSECQTAQISGTTLSYNEYSLAESVQSLEITQLIKTENIIGNVTDDKGKNAIFDGVTTYDYQQGTQHIKGDYTYDGKTRNIDCTETYDSILPITITNEDDISNLLDWDGGEIGEYTATTCPNSYYDEDDEFDLEDENNAWNGTANMNTNYTLTDSTDKQHLLSQEMSMSR